MIREDDEYIGRLPTSLREAADCADPWDVPGLLRDAADRIEWLESANREATADGRSQVMSMYVSGPLIVANTATGKPVRSFRATHPNGQETWHDTAKQAADAVADSVGVARLRKIGAKGGCPFCGGWKDEAERIRMAAAERLSEANHEIAERTRAIDTLVRGIRRWASEEDGVPDWLWSAYENAYAILGMDAPEPSKRTGLPGYMGDIGGPGCDPITP